ncbi:hypothetical protein SAY87_019236 [Trapa incisa]|uniref:Kinesin motor domain-containing protein n=1 Tax=Trapa incisa TaxID=236973 RepID=A0AAN7JZL1_9MYRT|nr:hypothetical protein SAY87_019236 [Trapa incisa]
MESSNGTTTPHERDSSQCVRVAVNIRPLITTELLNGCTDCITVIPREPQVRIGSHVFTYDYVYGNKGTPSSSIFDDCVAPLVEALFHGYNATVLAYGQTGSGKTYTMGTNYNGDESGSGIIPRVMETIYHYVETMKDSAEFLIRVSFIEIFKEEVFDLLDSSSSIPKVEGAHPAKTVGAARVPIQIRETVTGGITLAGVTEAEVRSTEEMASYLLRGSLTRATGSTNMNSQSSRSHAIFTISVEQKKSLGGCNGNLGDDILCSKLHLVDLAGSERAKRTGADGMRLKEGIHINKGLLALGNVISALGDERKRKEGAHVPYRDSKLTRLLQASCVSPADTNAEETLNTLKYANRARNIQNKAIINRDPTADQLQRMRSQIEQLQSELLFYRGDMSTPFEELQLLKHKVSLLEASNMELQRELQERQISCDHLARRAINAQVEKDKLIMQIESARNGKSWDDIDIYSDKEYDLINNYVSKIQELEGELLRLQNVPNLQHHVTECTDSDVDGLNVMDESFTCLNELSSHPSVKDLHISDDSCVKEKEMEHSDLQEKLGNELKELDQKLEEKEAEMKRFAAVDYSVIKHHYEKKLLEMEHEKKSLQKEIVELRGNLANISSASDDGAQKLKEEYLQKLNLLEAQVSELKKKQDAQAQILRQKQKSDEAARRLQDEIQRIKSQKVQLQHKIKQESESFRLWKAAQEKEVLQLKKEGRRNEYEMHKLLALNQRQKLVLQRKTEEAAMATKRLKELLESKKTSPRETSNSGPGIQALMQAIEHELEVTVRVHEVRSAYEHQMEERAKMAKEIAQLKEEAQMQRKAIVGNCPQEMSPGARNSRIFALENMLSSSSGALVSMASQLSEAEEREKGFSGKGRWNQVRSLAEAKNLMNYLFNIASSSRCQLRDTEVDCREKDSEIQDLKEKVVKLTTVIRQMEMQKAELIQRVKSQEKTDSSGGSNTSLGAHGYSLRRQEYRNSIFLPEDMDTSESEEASDCDNHDDDDVDDVDWTPVCSCSVKSQCKTSKCKCRSMGAVCGPSCGCVSTVCNNRKMPANSTHVAADDSPKEDCSEKPSELISQGASLLQSAFGKKLVALGDDDGNDSKRKPLSDIGNKPVMPDVSKHNTRKKWGKKAVVQLIPIAPPSSDQPKTTSSEDVKKPDESIANDLSLKLPRAMRAPGPSSGNTLRERNSDPSSGPNSSKANTSHAPNAPAGGVPTSNEKENLR